MTYFLEQQGLTLLPFSTPKKRQDLKGEWPHNALKRGWIVGYETANLSKDTPSHPRGPQKQLTPLTTRGLSICMINISVWTKGRGPALKVLVCMIC